MISYSSILAVAKTVNSSAVLSPDQSDKDLHSPDLGQKGGRRVMLGIGMLEELGQLS